VNPNHSFQEGDLLFEFDPLHWQVRKYDQHSYFQGFSGVGLKGVDFVANFEGRELWLIEVKNYSVQRSIRQKEVDVVLRDPSKIVEALEQKFADTLAGIRAIYTYYQRKERKRWNWLNAWRRPDPEEIFWQEACQIGVETQQIRLVLWIASDQDYAVPIQKIIQGIQNHPNLQDYSVVVFEQDNSPQPPFLKVKFQP